jgi:hypothetical protein
MTSSAVPYVAGDFVGGALGDDWALGKVTSSLAIRFPLDLPVPPWPEATERLVQIATCDGRVLGEVSDIELEQWFKAVRSPMRHACGGRVAGIARLFDVELVRHGLSIVRPATPPGQWTVRVADLACYRVTRGEQNDRRKARCWCSSVPTGACSSPLKR